MCSLRIAWVLASSAETVQGIACLFRPCVARFLVFFIPTALYSSRHPERKLSLRLTEREHLGHYTGTTASDGYALGAESDLDATSHAPSQGHW